VRLPDPSGPEFGDAVSTRRVQIHASRISGRRSTVVRTGPVAVKAGVVVPKKIGCRVFARQLGGPKIYASRQRNDVGTVCGASIGAVVRSADPHRRVFYGVPNGVICGVWNRLPCIGSARSACAELR